MSKKKFFTLINGTSVHIAPDRKVIPSEEIGQLVDSQHILDLVKEDAESYRIEIAEECELVKEQARKEGYEEGYKEWVEHIAKLEAEIQQVRQDVEKVLIPVALKAAKKIVGREIELTQDTIVDIVSNGLKSVAQHKKIIIYVNKKDLMTLEANRSRIKDIFESLESLSIRERSDVTPGGCIIETEGGIINAQLENQWRVLEKAFETMTKKQPST